MDHDHLRHALRRMRRRDTLARRLFCLACLAAIAALSYAIYVEVTS